MANPALLPGHLHRTQERETYLDIKTLQLRIHEVKMLSEALETRINIEEHPFSAETLEEAKQELRDALAVLEKVGGGE